MSYPVAPVRLAALLTLAAALPVQAQDPLFEGDPVEPGTGRVIEILPGLPRFAPGPDEDFGTDDDVIDEASLGDVDLVVRVGDLESDSGIPETSPMRLDIPSVTTGRPGTGTELSVTVFSSDGSTPPSVGNPIVSPALEGNPVLIFAFADLDGDGYVGVTLLDGDPTDEDLEELELDPIARRFAVFVGDRAQGSLLLSVGGPKGAEARVLVAASAYAGPTRPDFFGGMVPDGPAVMSALPFLPRTDPDRVIDGNEPEPADPDGLVGAEIEDHFTPDPSEAYGELFTLPTNGSVVTIDVARARSGPVTTFGLVRPALPGSWDEDTGGALRPGLTTTGERVLVERLEGPFIDGDDAGPSVRLVPFDQLGNVTSLERNEAVLLLASAGLEITSPDQDADTGRERLDVEGAAGRAISLRGSGTLLVERLPEPGRLLLGLAGLLTVALRRSALGAWRAWSRRSARTP